MSDEPDVVIPERDLLAQYLGAPLGNQPLPVDWSADGFQTTLVGRSALAACCPGR